MQESLRLAEFISETDYGQIPSEVIETLKDCFIDTLGCAAYGSTAPQVLAVRDVAVRCGGRPGASVWFSRFRASALMASLVNGTAVHAYWLDDVHNAKVHPGAAVIPAAVALAESREITGRDFLVALAVGYETNIRICLAAGPSAIRLRGWQPSSLTGTFGAAAACARILNLGREQALNAFGLSGSMAGGIYAFSADGSSSERIHMGWAAHGGMMAALLAAAGLPGPSQVLEAPDGGFCRLFTSHPAWEELTAGLGEVFHAGKMSLKPYPVCGSLMPYVDAGILLAGRRAFSVQEIRQVRARVGKVIQVQCGMPYQQLGILHAQENLRYCVATSLLNGGFTVEHLTPRRMCDPEVLELISKIELVPDPELDALYPARFAAVLEVDLMDGSTVKSRVEDPKGSVKNPMTHQEVVEKFYCLTEQVVNRVRAQKIVSFVEELENRENLNELLKLLRGGKQ